MNTPAHVVLSGLVLGRGRWRDLWIPVTAGAILPDLPMFGFYFVQRVILGNAEQYIWAQAYFQPHWQAFFDVFNSLPFIAVGALVAWRVRSPAWLAFFLSMALHCVADLPLHREDAHAHFFPFTSWHFQSPISYWDPKHYGFLFAIAEGLLVVGGSVALLWRSRPRPWRVIGAITLAIYVALWVFLLVVWIIPSRAGEQGTAEAASRPRTVSTARGVSSKTLIRIGPAIARRIDQSEKRYKVRGNFKMARPIQNVGGMSWGRLGIRRLRRLATCATSRFEITSVLPRPYAMRFSSAFRSRAPSGLASRAAATLIRRCSSDAMPTTAAEIGSPRQ